MDTPTNNKTETNGAWFFQALLYTMQELYDSQQSILREFSINCWEREQLARDLSAHLYHNGLLSPGEEHPRAISGIISEGLFFRCILFCLEATMTMQQLEEWTRKSAGWYGEQKRVPEEERRQEDAKSPAEGRVDPVSIVQTIYPRACRTHPTSRPARSAGRTRWNPPGALSDLSS
jgi:hypothetical protein